MTQVANLNAGMGMSVRTNAASKQGTSKELLEEFAGIMNQNTQSFLQTSTDSGVSTDGMSDDRASVKDVTDTVKKDYEKFGSSGSRKITKAQPESKDNEAVSQKVQELADEVKDAVQETMQVTDEDIEQAMEVLGLEVMDLLQPQNLIQLVQELTESTDVSALLTNENFQMTMQEVTGLITEFQQDNGLSAVQFSDLLEQLSAQIDELEETVKELLNVDEVSQDAQVPDTQSIGMDEATVAEQNPSEETLDTAPKAEMTVNQRTMAAQTTTETDVAQVSEQTTEQVSAVQEEKQPTEETAQHAGDDENPTSQGEKDKQQSATVTVDHTETTAEQHVGIFRENTAVANEQTVTATPETPQVQSYVELEHLMDQMEGLARTFASTEGTTVEMQLNPESLGRLVLSVTEKHGNVTAQITASNEQVKEALQTQMVELRSTLQAQGIKVEAVEVTVATHEFEQNLDGNTSANGQMQEQAGRQNDGTAGGRRNLNMNNLDELSGLMSEEETLVAQMMRDNGGTVDFTA